MKISEEIKEHVSFLFNKAQKVAVIGHKNPDGDALGSILGLTEIFTQRGKICIPITYDQGANNLKFLPNYEKIIHKLVMDDYDLIIVCDSATKNMTGFEKHEKLFTSIHGIPIINIDHHHVSNEIYGTINIVNNFASTTVIITDLLLNIGWEINCKAATCFLTGIYTDTGSFMHSNTDPFTLKMASKLLLKGANLRLIRKNIFKTTQISTLRLWGRVLSNIDKNDQGVTVSVVTDNDFKETGAHYSDLTGIIDYVNSVPNSNFSIILTEREGQVKGSLRTLKDDVDLSEIASFFGGGGHKKAAGFTVPGKLEKEVRWNIVE